MIKILTFFYNSTNYGGMLQAYALCRFLSIHNYKCEQICYSPTQSGKSSFIKKLKRLNIKKVFIKLHMLGNAMLFKLFCKNGNIRRQRFRDFQEQEVPHTTNVFTEKNLSLSVSSNDVIIVGSDQVWNPFWTNDNYFLDFVPSGCPKIAYAASLGISSIPPELFINRKKFLDRFHLISVREKIAQQLLSVYTRARIHYVVDPTFLIKREQWDLLCQPPSIKEPYIFAYILGNNKNQKSLIKKIASLLNCKVVYIPHVHFLFNFNDLKIGDYNITDAGPKEFIGLIKNAEMVLTDSFHGCVFSIIYHKKFWAFNRHSANDKENMNSRLDSLFSTLKLQNRYIKSLNIQDLSIDYLQQPIDYVKVQSECDTFIKTSSSLLLNAIKDVE